MSNQSDLIRNIYFQRVLDQPTLFVEYNAKEAHEFWDDDAIPQTETETVWLWFDQRDTISSLEYPGDRIFFASRELAYQNMLLHV